MPVPTNCEYVTVVEVEGREAVSANGGVIPPFIILSGKFGLLGCFEVSEYEEKLIDMSDNG